MREESKLYFWDAAGKFDAVKEDAHAACRDSRGNAYDLTIYSLTPKGETEPARLIVKMTPAGRQDSYLSAQRPDVEEANVSMLSLNYQTFPADRLKWICETLTTNFRFKNPATGYAELSRYEDERRNGMRSAAVVDFFGLDPREDEPGAQIYLRDKAFFLSMLPDPKRPDFTALSLLTDAQKAEILTIDMTHADISGKKSLAGMFYGYKRMEEVDLSAIGTTGVTDMREMFKRCYSLRRLDLSAFDFSRVENMESMFCECWKLEEVILSDTILGAGKIPHYIGSRTMEELNAIYKQEYIARGPNLADRTVESIMKKDEVDVPFSEATEEEVRRYLGLQYGQQVKLTIVPHRAPSMFHISGNTDRVQ